MPVRTRSTRGSASSSTTTTATSPSPGGSDLREVAVPPRAARWHIAHVHSKRLLPKAACAALLGALALAPAPAPAQARAAGSDCQGGAGLKVNRWIGQQSGGEVGLWNNDDNWSRGRYP